MRLYHWPDLVDKQYVTGLIIARGAAVDVDYEKIWLILAFKVNPFLLLCSFSYQL